jgi:hypothetical protein
MTQAQLMEFHQQPTRTIILETTNHTPWRVHFILSLHPHTFDCKFYLEIKFSAFLVQIQSTRTAHSLILGGWSFISWSPFLKFNNLEGRD